MASFGPRTAYEGWRQPFGRIVYALRAGWRLLRVSRPFTCLAGPQYRRSRNRIEIDITYTCDLRCLNCNRSVGRAPTTEQMSLDQIGVFVDESLRSGRRWERIRVLGGEPTLHPDVVPILALLQRRLGTLGARIELATNGLGRLAGSVLARLPAGITVDNSNKSSVNQPMFRPFSLAPRDLRRHWLSSYKNACQIAQTCGMGLTPNGYYVCAVAGGIDRVVGLGLGRRQLPRDADDMLDQAAELCGMCGRFLDGHFVPRNLRRPLLKEAISRTWRDAYARYEESEPRLPRLAEPPR